MVFNSFEGAVKVVAYSLFNMVSQVGVYRLCRHRAECLSVIEVKRSRFVPGVKGDPDPRCEAKARANMIGQLDT